MKYLPVFFTFFAGAFAQGINFSIPKDSSTIPIGENLISINQPNTATGLENVAIVIFIGPCPEGTCPDPNERLGMTLYSGPFNPQYPAFGTPDDQPQQNFTIDVPQNLAGKQVQLSAVLFALIGAGPAPFYSVKNITAYVEYS